MEGIYDEHVAEYLSIRCLNKMSNALYIALRLNQTTDNITIERITINTG